MEWADYAAVQAQCENLSGNQLTRNLSGNIRQQSSQLAEPLWTDPGLRTGISVRDLISATTTKKKRKRGMNCQKFSPNPRTRGKNHHHHHHMHSDQSKTPATGLDDNEALKCRLLALSVRDPFSWHDPAQHDCLFASMATKRLFTS